MTASGPPTDGAAPEGAPEGAPSRGAAVRRSAAALLAVGLLALLGLVVAGVVLNARAERAFGEALAARALSAAADGLRSALQAAESSQRGYVVTGNQIYLAPYASATAEARTQAEALRAALVADRPGTAPALDRLEAIVAEKVEEMDAAVDLQRRGRGDEARALIQTNRGKALMDEANVFLLRFVRIGDAELRTAADAQRRGLAILRTVNAVAAALVAAVGLAALWIVATFARGLARARDEVALLNADLERRVERRTAELAAARDRAELLMAEVNHRVANSLALVASMIRLQARGTADTAARDLLMGIHDRVSAVALVHRRLYASPEVNAVDLADFLATLVDQLGAMMRETGHEAQVTRELAPIVLPTDKGVSLGVIATELVTNAFKYAYPQGGGEIRVRLAREGAGQGVLTVADDGVGRAEGAAPRGTGLGSRLVAAMVGSLGGRLDYLDGAPGTVARVTFPI